MSRPESVALYNQLSELIQTLRASLFDGSVVTLANSHKVACVASSSDMWLIDSGASSHMSDPDRKKERMQARIAMLVSSLPLDLVADIISRLSVKSLLQMRCVCKDWCNLIDSTDFVNLHLTRSTKNEMSQCLILESRGLGETFLYSIELRSLSKAVELDINSWQPNDRWDDSFYKSHVLCGSCHGLVCLAFFWKYVALWNPATKKHLFLSPLTLDDDDGLQSTGNHDFVEVDIGFGFDSASGDYKIVSILEQHAHNVNGNNIVKTEVKVYSLKSNSWRRVYGTPKEQIRRSTNGVLVRETLYWLVSILKFHGEEWSSEVSACYNSIFSFDLQSEKLRFLLMPINTKDSIQEEIFPYIHVIGGFLSASYFYENGGFDLWVMKEHGAEESWTKLISISDPFLSSFYNLWPISYSKNNELLIIADEASDRIKVIRYDIETKAFEEKMNLPLPRFASVKVFYSESLVCLVGGDH